MHVQLDKWQEEILDYKGHILLGKGRRIGATYIFGIKAVEHLMNNYNPHPSSQIVCVSLTEDQAELIIAFATLHAISKYKKYVGKGKDRPTLRRLIMKVNGNRRILLARPVGTTGDAARGFEGQVLMVDEAARMPISFWTAAKPILMTTGGKIWMWSTFFGKEAYFWKKFDEAWNKKDPKARFKVWMKDSEDVMENRPICESWTEEQKREALLFLDEEKLDMSELEYAQEYLAIASEKLRQFYSDKLIKKVTKLKEPKQIFEQHQHFLGCDIARMGGDYGTWEIIKYINKDNMEHVYHEQRNKIPTTYTFDRIVELQEEWNFKQIGIDAGSGSLGVGVLDFLLREPIVRKKVVALNNKSIALDHEGKRSRMLLKEDMHSIMLNLLEMGKLMLLDNDEVRLSLKSVQYEYVRKEGMPTKIRIFGRNAHIVEGLIRAAYLANQKHLKLQLHWI